MNELQVFKNAEFGSIRTLLINGEPYFVGKDVAEILGYERPTKAVSDHVDPEDITMWFSIVRTWWQFRSLQKTMAGQQIT